MGDLTEPLRELFKDADSVIAELGHEFTSHEFIRRITQRNQPIYIDLLIACRDKHDRIFGFAHQMIGNQLSKVAQKAGYQMLIGGTPETDLFGAPAERVTYRRHKQ